MWVFLLPKKEEDYDVILLPDPAATGPSYQMFLYGDKPNIREFLKHFYCLRTVLIKLTMSVSKLRFNIYIYITEEKAMFWSCEQNG